MMMYKNNYAGGGITTLPGYFLGGFLGKAAGFLKKAAPILGSTTGIGGLLLPLGLEAIRAYRSRGSQNPAQMQPQDMPQYNFGMQQQYSPYSFGGMPMGGMGGMMGGMGGMMGGMGGIQSLPTMGYPGRMPSYQMYGSPSSPMMGQMTGFSGASNTPSTQSPYGQPTGGYSSPAYRGPSGGDNTPNRFSDGMGYADGGRVEYGYADGGRVQDSVVYEGRIPFKNDGTMESSGAVDDRVAVAKPDISDVTPQSRDMLETLKFALKNPEEPASQDIISLAIQLYGEDFVQRVMDKIESGDGSLEQDMDSMVEMEFKKKLANNEPLDVVAAVAPGEFIMTKDATDKATNLPETMRKLESMNGPARLEVRSA
jgi:hypothetical protein